MNDTYYTLPVVVHARQFTGAGLAGALIEWCGGQYLNNEDRCVIAITTLDGTAYAELGDWIIQGVKGEFYSCKHDTFVAMYEKYGDVRVGLVH